MVKKIILEIDCNCKEHAEPSNITRESLISTNDKLQHTITTYKNRITPFYNNKKWDKYKKLSNEYELIFTTPSTKSNISIYNPVSRSFFKMWELLHDFTDAIIPKGQASMKCLFLAEGPGGFLEAVMKYRNTKQDAYYGMTLRADHKSIPEWKLKKFDKSIVTTLYGEDGTGNLYNLQNTHYLVHKLGGASMDLITADGGFDFSADFNKQEDLSVKLIRCELFCTFHMLREGGTFILKIYDMFHHNTLHTFSILKQCFQKIYIVKPLSSRPANSEKYLICVGYRYDQGMSCIGTLMNLICKRAASPSRKHILNTIDLRLLHKIVMYNIYYTSRQVYYIQRTIDIINKLDKLPSNERATEFNTMMSKNLVKCKRWCVKYNIPHVT